MYVDASFVRRLAEALLEGLVRCMVAALAANVPPAINAAFVQRMREDEVRPKRCTVQRAAP